MIIYMFKLKLCFDIMYKYIFYLLYPFIKERIIDGAFTADYNTYFGPVPSPIFVYDTTYITLLTII